MKTTAPNISRSPGKELRKAKKKAVILFSRPWHLLSLDEMSTVKRSLQ